MSSQDSLTNEKAIKRISLTDLAYSGKYKIDNIKWFKALADLFLNDDGRIVAMQEQGRDNAIWELWNATPAFEGFPEIFEGFLSLAERGKLEAIDNLLKVGGAYEGNPELFKGFMILAEEGNFRGMRLLSNISRRYPGDFTKFHELLALAKEGKFTEMYKY